MRHSLFFLIAFIAIALDQLAKYIVRTSMQLGESLVLIPKFLYMTYTQNSGAGFGILQGQTLLLAFISLIVIGYILYSLDKIKQNQRFLQASLALVMGGAVGNVIDRFAYGYVIDFIDLGWWPIFNTADMCLSIGVVGLLWHFWNNDN